MFKKEGTINDAIIENMLSWNHSGFQVYIGDRIYPSDKAGTGNLARYIVRACFSQERMVYVPVNKSDDGIAKGVYTAKDKKSRKVFNALDWLGWSPIFQADMNTLSDTRAIIPTNSGG